MNGIIVRVLLVEDHLAEARFLQEVLSGDWHNQFELVHVSRLKEAIAQLTQRIFDVVLLDLTLPDSQGLTSLDTLITQAPSLPIVVLTNTNDDALALEAVRQGAQDYLVKRHVTWDVLVRSLRYAIERKQASEALREANEALEQRVQQRTRDLATTNALLIAEIQNRQQMQERLELSQKVGKIGTFEWLIQTNVITWTRELEALYGLAPGSFGGKYDNWVQALHPDDRLPTEQAIWHAVREGTELDIEFRILCPTGETRWIAAKSSVFNDDFGRPLRLLGVHIDITEKKQLEAQFLQAQRLESIGTLASGIAHDLNNILTPILVITQLLPLKVSELNDSSQQLLKTLEINVRRGADLVKQILSFARGVEGKRMALQAAHLIREIREMIEQTFPRSIEIRVNIGPDLATVLADVTQLHQVLMNLCVNARDAMPGGGLLQLSARNCSLDEREARKHFGAKSGDYVLITVTDTGTGMPPEVLGRIFDPFFTTKEVGKGTGLGLSAVIGIVKSHGGWVEVQSEVGRGSEFRVYLPGCLETAQLDEMDSDRFDGQGAMILVVDDEASIGEITKTMLEFYNYKVVLTQTGLDAIAVYRQHRSEIRGAVLDLMMPGVDGMATLGVLRQLNPDLRAIAMSGLMSPDLAAQAHQAGFQSLIAKPFTSQELLQALYALKLVPLT